MVKQTGILKLINDERTLRLIRKPSACTGGYIDIICSMIDVNGTDPELCDALDFGCEYKDLEACWAGGEDYRCSFDMSACSTQGLDISCGINDLVSCHNMHYDQD